MRPANIIQVGLLQLTSVATRSRTEMCLLIEVQKYSLASGHPRVTEEEVAVAAVVEEVDSGAEVETDMKEVDGTVGIQGTGTGTGTEIVTGAIKARDND